MGKRKSKKRYRLWKRGKYYYYRLPGMTKWKSTGCTIEEEARDFALERKHELKHELNVKPAMPLREYLEPFYHWNCCPHVLRLRSDGKPISLNHVKACRSLIDNKILTDPIADKNIHELRRGDFIDFKARLLLGNGPRTVNRTMGVLKTALKEGYFREDLERDPTQGIGSISYKVKESGIFSRGELQSLFPAVGLGRWRDLPVYTAFLLLATCGLRKGELLALRWEHLDFDNQLIHVKEALKNPGEIGKPKWNKERHVPLPSRAVTRLKKLRSESMHVLPASFVFSRDDGEHQRRSWLDWHFEKTMRILGIDRKARNLRIHSFRHSLNMLLRDAGYSDEKIRAAMGWSSPEIQDIYTHWKPEHLSGQAKIIDGIFK